jgi:heterodisulfide reductase subunit A
MTSAASSGAAALNKVPVAPAVPSSVAIIGGGIAGIQASLDLADMGVKVYLIEKQPSVGGVMAQLDKTFPTNDCAV